MQMNPQTRKLLTVFGCVLLVLYVLVACLWANFRADSELCEGLEGDKVYVDDELHTGFVTADELTGELKPLLGDLTSRKLSEIGLDSLRSYLCGLDKIETAEVMRLNNNRLRVRVVPMVPVARVWPPKGRSYYVNREGKKILATARYHLDVPQISGTCPPSKLLPLLDYLSAHEDAGRLITMISASDSTDVILVPAIRGHVINLGDCSDIDDKFRRLKRFYSEVLPVKGWEHYDTISLKWDRQVVATRRHGKLPDLSVEIIDELENEGDDLSTVEAPGTTEKPEEQKPQ